MTCRRRHLSIIQEAKGQNVSTAAFLSGSAAYLCKRWQLDSGSGLAHKSGTLCKFLLTMG